jgi:hypothetical protein
MKWVSRLFMKMKLKLRLLCRNRKMDGTFGYPGPCRAKAMPKKGMCGGKSGKCGGKGGGMPTKGGGGKSKDVTYGYPIMAKAMPVSKGGGKGGGMEVPVGKGGGKGGGMDGKGGGVTPDCGGGSG